MLKLLPLLNKDGEAIPLRPNYGSDIIKHAVQQFIALREGFYNISTDKMEAFIQDLCEVWKPNTDAYPISKEMENKGHLVNAEFVDDMDRFTLHLYCVQENAESEWYRVHQPALPLPYGTTFDMVIDGEVRSVRIDTIYRMSPAKYVVVTNDTHPTSKRTKITFEDALALYTQTEELKNQGVHFE